LIDNFSKSSFILKESSAAILFKSVLSNEDAVDQIRNNPTKINEVANNAMQIQHLQDLVYAP
jgi:hypothetical protein